MVVIIFLLIHLIMMLINLLLIFLSHRSLVKHLLMKWKMLKLSTHFKPS